MQLIQSTKSVARLCRQLIHVPPLHNRWLTAETKQQLSQSIATAELGHRGEIYLIVENHLPIATAYHQDCRERALYLFATHRVWDTEQNTGVLIYLNLCEHDLEIIADRGIDQKAHDNCWQQLCQQTLDLFKQGQMQAGLARLIEQIGNLLRKHYPDDDTAGNELSNQVVYLR